jgi:hypothetical protein
MWLEQDDDATWECLRPGSSYGGEGGDRGNDDAMVVLLMALSRI